MTDDERRKWLAGLRPFDRAAIKKWSDRYRHGCTLLERYKPYPKRPDGRSWVILLDAIEYEEERYTTVYESELEPLPFPDMKGDLLVGPPLREPRRSRPRPKAKTASA
jgi:hypothetical protein